MDLNDCGRGCHTMQAAGRLAPGVSLAAAADELNRFGESLQRSYPETNTDKRFMIRELKATIVGNVRAGLWIMLGAVGLVLLIACANVANLLLARASAREGEIAVMAAPGASRARLAAHILAESGVLAAMGGVLGIAFAFGGVRLLRNLEPGTLPRAESIGIDATVLLVTLTVIFVVTFLFGSVPALTMSRASIAGRLSTMGRGGTAARGAMSYRFALLAAEVALSVSLLIGAGLLLRTFAELYAVNEVLRFQTATTRFYLFLVGSFA